MADVFHAATVVLLRDGDDGLETLMLRKNSRLAFGGMWVFPGGRIDDGDRRPAPTSSRPPRTPRCARRPKSPGSSCRRPR
jgi:8-oxo-dGTP pyrophosphatase MutT (NUDIX family)